MSASPPLRQPCPPGACVCERERLEAPGADRRILLLTRQERAAPGRSPGSPAQPAEDLEHLLRRMEEQLGIRLRIAAVGRCAACAHPHALRGAAGALPQRPAAIPAAIRRGLEKRPEVAYALLNAHDLLRDA